MIGILLTVLKIIGIILLILVLVILSILCLILFVPLRYRANAAYNDKVFRGAGSLSWFLRIIRLDICYDNDLKMKFCVFGHDFLNNDKREKNTVDTKSELPKPQAPVSTNGNEKPQTEKKTVSEEKKSEPKAAGQTKKATEKKKNVKKNNKKKPEVKTKGESLKEKIVRYKELFFTDDMKRAVCKVKNKIIKLVKHILPVKTKGYVHFGFEDQSKTGEVLGMIAAVYPLAADSFEIEPDFEKEVLEADIAVKGRVYIFYVLFLAVSILADKNIRSQIRLIKQGGKTDGK